MNQFARNVLCAVAFLLIAGFAEASTCDNVRPGSDIVMKDLRWPVWAQGTYFCYWYVSFVPKAKQNPTFYGGVATSGPEKPPGMFHSFWGDLTHVHEGMEFYRHGYGAEGAKGGVNGKPSFLRPNVWYRNVLRVFPPARGADTHTWIGWWVKDCEKNEWHTHSVVSVRMKATGVSGNGGFVEALAPETVSRIFDRRLGYCRLDGKWFKADAISTECPQFIRPIENGTALRYERSSGEVPGKGKVDVTTPRQPGEPTLDPPAIEDAKATSHGRQVAVKWTIPASASPQFGYRIEVFENSEAKGTPLVAFEDIAPHVLAKRLDLDRAARSVRLTVTDIFDQQVSVHVPVKTATPANAAKDAAAMRPGLRYAYYEAPKDTVWEKLPDFPALKPLKQGIVKTPDDTIREGRDKFYAMQYSGFIRAPETGLYVLAFGTCDGGRLRLDGQVVADNDGIHGTSVKQYPVALEKGLHPFELSYFKGSKGYLGDKILLTWEGPGFAPRSFQPTGFACADDPGTPAIAMPAGAFPTGVLEDNLVTIKPVIEGRGHKIAKVQFYRDRLLLGTAVNDAPGGVGELAFSNLLPEGTNHLWARLWYDGSNSIDSDVLSLQAKNKVDGAWTFDDFGEKFPLAFRAHEGTISFRGEGFCFVRQTVASDFTLTARVADICPATKENGVPGHDWLGLYMQTGRRGPFDGTRFGIYCLARGAVKGSADFPDLGGGNMSIPSFPKDHRWLRMVRRGVRFQTFTSTDGTTWRKAAEQILPKCGKGIPVGLVFRAVPGKADSLFYGSFDHVTLTPDVPQESREAVRREDLPRPGQVTALVQAGKTGALYARTMGRGVLRSTDGGASWKPANAGLSGAEALSVRTVAVHPKDNAILLLGAGAVVDGKLKSGLFRSADAGTSWKRVPTDIDFDGRGPTAIFGEVMAFNPKNPDMAAAAGETGGLFLSSDAGVTWKHAGLKDERVTCLSFVPDTKVNKGDGVLIVGTFDDREFETLGLGKPASPATAPGRVHWIQFRDGKCVIRKPSWEMAGLGVTNLGQGTHPNFVTFATTRGVYYTWQHGNVFGQRRDNLPADLFYTALGCKLSLKETRKDDWRWRVNTYAAPFSGQAQSPVYAAFERETGLWSAPSGAAKVEAQGGTVRLGAGVTCILPDKDQENTLYLCNRDGVFKSTDKGKSYRLVCPCETDKR